MGLEEAFTAATNQQPPHDDALRCHCPRAALIKMINLERSSRLFLPVFCALCPRTTLTEMINISVQPVWALGGTVWVSGVGEGKNKTKQKTSELIAEFILVLSCWSSSL